MSFATKPTFVLQPFANNGLKNSIPNTTASDGYASYDQGFPEITMQPKESGGLPPRGQDMNGILNNGGSKFDIYNQMGGTYPLNTDILSNGGYAKNSVVYQDDGVYRSMVDNNTDNFITTPSVIGSTWQLLIDYNAQAGSNGVPLQMSYFARTDVPTGWLRCDGTQYNRASFPNFYDDYLVTGKAPTLSYTDYNLEVTDNGSCGSFALDEVNLTFKTPTITGSTFIAQALISGDIGKFNAESLPNIKGVVGAVKVDVLPSSPFKYTDGSPNIGGNSNTVSNQFRSTSIDLSTSSSVYQDSAIVQPNNIQFPVLVCVANVQVPVSEAQYNGFISNLNQKVDLDGSNANFSSLSSTAKENLNNKIDCIDFTSAIARTWNTEYTTTNAVYIQVGVSISVGNPVFLDIQGASITILAVGGVGSRPNQFFKIPPNTTWKVRGGEGAGFIDGFINEYQFL